MTRTQDSSVLFALDELRQQERVRARQESEKAREQAAVARRQAEEAVRRRLEIEQNAEELAKLRSQVQDDAANRMALEQQILTLESAAQTFKTSTPPPTSIVEVHASSSHHFVWAATLLFSCLGVYVATYSPQVPPAPIVEPVPAMVASNDCKVARKDAKNNSENRADAKPVDEAVAAPQAEPRSEPRRPRAKGGRETAKPPQTIVIEASDDPLYGLPE